MKTLEVLQMRTLFTAIALIVTAASAGIAADAKAGQAAYDKSCKSCHGPDGTPNPAIAKMMKVDMKDLKSAEVQGMSDADLKKVIADGKGKMKPIKTVTGADVDNVIAYIRTLKK
jgi:mono/diheme cytochrome c family protein